MRKIYGQESVAAANATRVNVLSGLDLKPEQSGPPPTTIGNTRQIDIARHHLDGAVAALDPHGETVVFAVVGEQLEVVAFADLDEKWVDRVFPISTLGRLSAERKRGDTDAVNGQCA